MSFSKEQKTRMVTPSNRSNHQSSKSEEKLEKIVDKLEEMTTNGRIDDIVLHFTNKREVIKVNILAGISRGVGLTLGTAIFIGLFILLLTQMISLPIVGQWVANFLEMVESYRQ
ncbi:DUF5665 domain-containing protein [Alkalihalobacillus trypoxylicola]|uniref:Uncharacterized protein n=1 Tax=Alkalihalobacillus trypoxylicola TaxID=519424 RepID=A0A161PHR4_9BACI|nr:DUF5665 domain-containing protein [Alkalihalobacillus trypoxylicola]KYG32424.1 hypothetical protein AZF04_06605 [Alkalihalobacillus trypoxylicola]GAF66857.1 hypothetical protein BTS2_3762 [Bacillus sp. TS-2]